MLGCEQVGHEQYAETTAACAEALVTVRWLGFHRVWQGSGEAFDHVDLFLPDVQFPTQVPTPSLQLLSHVILHNVFGHAPAGECADGIATHTALGVSLPVALLQMLRQGHVRMLLHVPCQIGSLLMTLCSSPSHNSRYSLELLHHEFL